MKCFLLDVGSTFIKYAVYDNVTYEVIYSDKLPFPEPTFFDGVRFCVSRCEIERIIIKLFKYAEKQECKSAFISVQMHGYIVRNKTGELSDYISWRDNSGDVSNELLSEIDFDLLGTSLKKNLPLVKLLHAKDVEEFFTLGSYISWMFTKNNATHITDACASGFFYLNNAEYNGYLNDSLMPRVHTEVKAVGNWNGIAVYTPVGDHQASFLGCGACEKMYLLNIGTASQLSCVASLECDVEECEKRPYFEKGKRLYTFSGLVGGDRLFSGKGEDELVLQVTNALDKLPKKSGIVLGGGGSGNIYRAISQMSQNRAMECRLIEKNIGMEGLMILAGKANIKIGTMLSEVQFVNYPIIVHSNGLDFLVIDCEHGAFEMSVLSGLIMTSNLIGLETVIRLPNNSRENIIKLADMGARGFLLPMTDKKEDIEQVVRFAKYSPLGKRGISTTRAHTLYDPPSLNKYKKEANNSMRIYAQIETVRGVDNIADILSVDGVDGVFIGPNDLADDLGCIGDKEPIFRCIDRVASAVVNANKTWGIITGDAELIEYSRSRGVCAVSVGSELNMLINGCKKVKEMF